MVDVWDALRSDRPYRPAWTPEKVLAHIRDQANRHFDPQVVAAFEAWQAAEKRTAAARQAAPTALPVVLIVDDEENVTRSLARSLRAHYTVLTASSGQAALDALEREKVAVIVTDQRMPGLTGLQLLQRARLLSPTTRALLISGYTDSASLSETLALSNVRGFLSKPWQPDELERRLRDAADDYSAALREQAVVEAIRGRDA